MTLASALSLASFLLGLLFLSIAWKGRQERAEMKQTLQDLDEANEDLGLPKNRSLSEFLVRHGLALFPHAAAFLAACVGLMTARTNPRFAISVTSCALLFQLLVFTGMLLVVFRSIRRYGTSGPIETTPEEETADELESSDEGQGAIVADDTDSRGG